MKLVDLNRDGGIGANALYVEIGPFRLLVDAGMHPKKAGLQSLPKFDLIESDTLDFIILTHCHLDHLGALPVAARHQPQAQILTSPPSRMLAPRMLHNSCNIMLRQRDELRLPELPLYTHGEVDALESRMLSMPYRQPRSFHLLQEEIEICFFHSGHIAGAVSVLIRYKHRKIFFTGDVLFAPLRTLAGASLPQEECDTLVTETTRGSTPRDPKATREAELDRLLTTIDHTISRGGSCLLPVFALGRMQEMFACLLEARREGKIRRFPIYSTGMGLDLAHLFDRISRKTGMVNFRRKVLQSLKLSPLPRNLKPGQQPAEPGLFLVSSGMMVARTPSYRVAASLLSYHKNSVCFIGYCDPDTPGGKLLDTLGGHSFLFDTLDYACPVNAQIRKFDLSGHADREELLDYALAANPRAVVLTHGDPEARLWFHDAIIDTAPSTQITDPAPLQSYQI